MNSKHFTIKELVPRKTYEEYGNEAWKLLDKKAVDTIDFIREKLDLPITVNDWAWGGKFQYRGYRPENCPVGADRSAHKDGCAFDFDVKGMTAEEVRQWLEKNKHELPHPIRCEKVVNWVHIDTRAKLDYKLYFFQP